MVSARSIVLRRATWVAFAGACLAARWIHAETFGFDDVEARARDLAGKSFQAGDSNLRGPLQRLKQEQYQAITFRPAAGWWRADDLPFALEFFHEGWRFDRPVAINEVAPNVVHAIPFTPQWFDYGDSGVDPATGGALGYAGLRVKYALNAPGQPDEVLSFLGASYFRALGIGQFYGLSARGLAIDTALPSGEEFPRFVEFWIERPAADAKQLTLYALLDSPRATGAFRFVLHPGIETVIDVTARLYLRASVGKFGIAPLTSMYFFGSNQHGNGEDYRSEVHDSEGLSIKLDSGEWIWRPLVNPKRLLVTAFAATQPRGFGLMQRSREFVRYNDLQARYEAQPSGWVEPVGDWGAGQVELVEIPTPDETNDNIVAYWVPDRAPAPHDSYDMQYRIHWQKEGETLPPTAWVAQTLRGKGYQASEEGINFIVDWQGPMFSTPAAEAGVEAEVTADANGVVLAHALRANPATGGRRLSVQIKRLDDNKPVEMRARLRSGDKESETWSYILPAG
jgi:glucans biosynthesis protein